MYKKILVPSDGSELSAKAVNHGVKLARELGASVVFVTVSTPFHSIDHEPTVAADFPDDYKKYVHDFLTEESRGYLEAARDVAEKAGVTCETRPVQHDHVYRGIIDTAGEAGCDLIVMASHGRRGISAVVLGSETSKVLTHSNIPVLVCR